MAASRHESLNEEILALKQYEMNGLMLRSGFTREQLLSVGRKARLLKLLDYHKEWAWLFTYLSEDKRERLRHYLLQAPLEVINTLARVGITLVCANETYSADSLSNYASAWCDYAASASSSQQREPQLSDYKPISAHPNGWKSVNHFGYRRVFKQTQGNSFSHRTFKVKKRKPLPEGRTKTDWYQKQFTVSTSPQFEACAQEIMRVMRASRVKTRVVHSNGIANAVVSKEVPGGASLSQSDLFKDELNEALLFDVPYAGLPKYTGLGELMVLALFLNENDLQEGNVYVDRDNRLEKIDGNQSFWRLLTKESDFPFQITTEVLESLPERGHYAAFQWLDVGEWFDAHIDPQRMGGFYDEVNTMLLKILLMPEELLIRIAQHHVAMPRTIDCVLELFHRKNQLERAAWLHMGFQELMYSERALQVKTQFIEQLKGFKLTGKHLLVNELNAASVDSQVEQAFSRIRDIMSIATPPSMPSASSSESSSESLQSELTPALVSDPRLSYTRALVLPEPVFLARVPVISFFVPRTSIEKQMDADFMSRFNRVCQLTPSIVLIRNVREFIKTINRDDSIKDKFKTVYQWLKMAAPEKNEHTALAKFALNLLAALVGERVRVENYYAALEKFASVAFAADPLPHQARRSKP